MLLALRRRRLPPHGNAGGASRVILTVLFIFLYVHSVVEAGRARPPQEGVWPVGACLTGGDNAPLVAFRQPPQYSIVFHIGMEHPDRGRQNRNHVRVEQSFHDPCQALVTNGGPVKMLGVIIALE